MTITTTPTGNALLQVTIPTAQTLTHGTIRDMGLVLAKGQGGQPLYNITELPAEQEVVLDKRDWTGGLGAYLHNPNMPNRYAMGVTIDATVPGKVMLGPYRFTAGPGSGDAAFASTTKAAIEYSVSSVPTLFIGNGRYFYKLAGWTTGPYFDQVYDIGSATESYNFTVYQSYLFAAVDGAVGFRYTADGASWTTSTLGGNGLYANRFAVVNGALHKMRGQQHSVVTAKAAALNDGANFSTESLLGDICWMHEILGANNAVVLCQEDGIYTIDGFGNPVDLFPELKTVRNVDNGQRSRVFMNDVYYPTAHGQLWWLSASREKPQDRHPAVQVDKALEILPYEYANLNGPIRALAIHPKWLYAVVQRIAPAGSNHRLCRMQLQNGRPVWHTVSELEYAEQGIAFVTSGATSGPVLWVAEGVADNYKLAYYFLPQGDDASQDDRCRFEANGKLYEPWWDGGFPTWNKRHTKLQARVKIPDRPAMILDNCDSATGWSSTTGTLTLDTTTKVCGTGSISTSYAGNPGSENVMTKSTVTGLMVGQGFTTADAVVFNLKHNRAGATYVFRVGNDGSNYWEFNGTASGTGWNYKRYTISAYNAIVGSPVMTSNLNYVAVVADPDAGDIVKLDQVAIVPKTCVNTCDSDAGWTFVGAETREGVYKTEGVSSLQVVGVSAYQYEHSTLGVPGGWNAADKLCLDIWADSSTDDYYVYLGESVSKYWWWTGDLIEGWNHLELSFSSSTAVGAPSLANTLNYFSLWADTLGATGVVRLDNIRIRQATRTDITIKSSLYGDNGTQGISSQQLANGYNDIAVAAGFNPKRSRLEFAYVSTCNRVTPILEWYQLKAMAQGPVRHRFDLTIDMDASQQMGFTPEQVRDFLLDLQDCTRPVTLKDYRDDSFTVMPANSQGAEFPTKYDANQWHEGAKIILVEEEPIG